MKKNVRIIVDSTADITKASQEKVICVPLSIVFGEEEFLDGVDITKDEFYERLTTEIIFPHTSQATPGRYEEVFRQVTDAGEEALVITLSSKLSGTYLSACLAAQEFPNIRVVDSLNAATGSGVLVEYALQKAEEGMGLEELAELITEKREDVRIVAIVDTLEYLKRGGRISKATAWAGEILNIKPVIAVKDGEVVVLGKARGSKKGNNYLNELASSEGIDYTKPILLAYSGTTDAMLKKYIEDSRHLWEGKIEVPESIQICNTIGTHVGPGAVAVAFFKEH